MKRLILMGLLVAGAALAAGCSSNSQPADTAAAPEAAPEETITLSAEDAVEETADGVRVTLYVTTDGWVPENVTVPANRPVTLVVTRKTDKTCATDLVMPSHSINQALPLDETVEITFTPTEAGQLHYACAMDMIAGTIVVQ